jgi:hypothetical protein
MVQQVEQQAQLREFLGERQVLSLDVRIGAHAVEHAVG